MKFITICFTVLLYLNILEKSLTYSLDFNPWQWIKDATKFVTSTDFGCLVSRPITGVARFPRFEVNFYIINRNIRSKELILKIRDVYQNRADFDLRKRTAFIVHGFQSNGNEQWLTDLANAYIEWEDANVVIVDWGSLADTFDYPNAILAVKPVGQEIAKLLKDMTSRIAESTTSYKYGKLHLLGHSLGAHVVGAAAYEIRRLNLRWGVYRITGFDPAQPCFNYAKDDERLSYDKAQMVDVIHSNGKSLFQGGLGIKDAIGDFDFYPNGGEKQPGCVDLADFSGIKEIAGTIICNHGSSYKYFIDSLRYFNDSTCKFKALKWDQDPNNIPSNIYDKNVCFNEDCIEMGINAEKYIEHVSGSFFAVTGAESPYCKIENNMMVQVTTAKPSIMMNESPTLNNVDPLWLVLTQDDDDPKKVQCID